MDRVIFNLWSNETKIEYLNDFGIMVARRYDQFYGFELYQFDDFYVEVQFYKSNGANKRIFIFDDLKYIEPYLLTINISGLAGIHSSYGNN